EPLHGSSSTIPPPSDFDDGSGREFSVSRGRVVDPSDTEPLPDLADRAALDLSSQERPSTQKTAPIPLTDSAPPSAASDADFSLHTDAQAHAGAGAGAEAPAEAGAIEAPAPPSSDRFTILDRIGTGGMGVVYRAHDRERGELVALKTMRRIDPRALY